MRWSRWFIRRRRSAHGTRLSRCRCVIATVALLAGGVSAAAGVSEQQVQAMFLFHFANFIEWPESSFADAASPFYFCVMGKGGTGEILRELIEGERVRGRPLVFRQLSGDHSGGPCHVLFVSSVGLGRHQQEVFAMNYSGVLTVSDEEVFASKGGMISLLNEGGRIRPAINLDALARGGLTASSKLLRLAKLLNDHPRQARQR